MQNYNNQEIYKGLIVSTYENDYKKSKGILPLEIENNTNPKIQDKTEVSKSCYIASQASSQAPVGAIYKLVKMGLLENNIDKTATGLISAFTFRALTTIIGMYVDGKIKIKDMQNVISSGQLPKDNPIYAIIRDGLSNILPVALAGTPLVMINNEIGKIDSNEKFIESLGNYSMFVFNAIAIILATNPLVDKGLQKISFVKSLKENESLQYTQKMTNNNAKAFVRVIAGTIGTFMTFYLAEKTIDKNDDFLILSAKHSAIGFLTGMINSATNQAINLVYNAIESKLCK